LNCFVFPAKITLPQDLTVWNSTAQETGEKLKCGSPDFFLLDTLPRLWGSCLGAQPQSA